MAGSRFGAQLLRYWAHFKRCTEPILLPNHCLLADQINPAGELIFATNRNLQQQRLGFELVANLTDDALIIGADPIHLINERDARHAIFVSLAPDGLRLWFNS